VLLPVTTTGAVSLALSLASASGAHAAPADMAGARVPARAAHPVRGLDISSYQHSKKPIDWRMLARHGISFVAVKVSEGTYYRNPFYRADVRAAAAAGLAVLPYVFANPARAGGATTARYAVQAAGGAGSLRGPGQLPLVVDLENNPYRAGHDCYGLRGRRIIGWIAGFVNQVKAETGKWPVIYTAASWWRECTGATSRFRRDPLWLAAFGGTRPTVPSTWEHWTFWQYDNAGRLPGIATTDLDYYQPTADLPAIRPLIHRVSRTLARHHAKARHHARPRHHAKPRHHARPRRWSLAAAHRAHLEHLAHLAHLVRMRWAR